jgi:branched-chain amino acid aminotransferase
MSNIVYFEGQFMPFESATLSVKAHAFMYGTGLFEGIRGYWIPETHEIAIFRMQEHYERLLQNSRIFFMDDHGHTVDGLCDLTAELVEKNHHMEDTYIRPTIFKNGINIGPNFDKAYTATTIWTHPLGNYVDVERGLNVCVSSWRRVDDNAIPPRAKATGAYMNTALIITEAKRRGFDEAIVLSQDGHVTEGSAMNLFVVRKGKLITPGITENILEGITRDTIMTLAKEELGLETETRQIDRTELYVCDEAFFCGTGAQVAPIGQIDHRPLGNGDVGPITAKIQKLYFDVVRGKMPKYDHWLRRVKITAPVGA